MIFYEISLSNGKNIEIDQQEFDGVVLSLGKGNFIKTKQGIFNTSFVVSINPVRKQPTTKIEGYIDERTGKFITTTYEKSDPEIKNKFTEDIKQLSDNFKIQ